MGNAMIKNKKIRNVCRFEQEQALDKKIQQAAANLFGSAKPADDAEIGARKEAWRSGGLAMPSQRTSDEPKGEKRALKTAAQYMRDHGMADEDDATTTNGFLD